ncbi:fasciclin domain-containing protein [Brevundimonas sp.]|uniref:fasciclin domain-containing protein n=1 Tax=Brevundimonas sp. TaxID=1871086 RepID=UPI0035AFCB0C
MSRMLIRGALIVGAIAVAACGRSDVDDSGSAQPAEASLASVLDRNPGHARLEAMIESTGLTEALDATGPYTLFAPPDDALATAGGDADMTDDALKAQAAQLLRAHIVPGALTRADIAAAVDRAGGEGAKMRTMADAVLTFTRDGERLVVRGPDGPAVALSGDEALARNGVIQPVSGLLLAPSTAPGAG